MMKDAMEPVLKFAKKIVMLMLIATTSCLEPYNPPAITDTIDILVVDGFINSSDNTATVRLTKATPLAEDSEMETGVSALVEIEEENGATYTMNEISTGNFTVSNLALDPTKRYRLSINRKYFSEYIELLDSPPIDSVTWKANTQTPGINILVNTHDDDNSTQYYQWTYNETWEYTSKYGAFFKLVSGVPLRNDIDVSRCWVSKASTQILVNSTNHLASNVVRDFPLTFIPARSQKVFVKYSVLVEQRGISQSAFNFWTQLKKTTESLGGLFDPLPAQVLGNIYNSENSAEPVLGYFSGGQVATKRIFIEFDDLPIELRLLPYSNCPVDSIPLDQIGSYPDMLLISSYGVPFTKGYVKSSGKNCMDCRDDGGYLVKPDFWK